MAYFIKLKLISIQRASFLINETFKNISGNKILKYKVFLGIIDISEHISLLGEKNYLNKPYFTRSERFKASNVNSEMELKEIGVNTSNRNNSA